MPKKSQTKKAPKKLSPMFQNKTTSKVPKTAREKKAWIQARRIAAKQAGLKTTGAKRSNKAVKQQEEKVSWGLVNKIYQNQLKADKIAKNKDWKKDKPSKKVKAKKEAHKIL
jgi:hypothetical protein